MAAPKGKHAENAETILNSLKEPGVGNLASETISNLIATAQAYASLAVAEALADLSWLAQANDGHGGIRVTATNSFS